MWLQYNSIYSNYEGSSTHESYVKYLYPYVLNTPASFLRFCVSLLGQISLNSSLRLWHTLLLFYFMSLGHLLKFSVQYKSSSAFSITHLPSDMNFSIQPVSIYSYIITFFFFIFDPLSQFSLNYIVGFCTGELVNFLEICWRVAGVYRWRRINYVFGVRDWCASIVNAWRFVGVVDVS
jgi:hypothetical protein